MYALDAGAAVGLVVAEIDVVVQEVVVVLVQVEAEVVLVVVLRAVHAVDVAVA